MVKKKSIALIVISMENLKSPKIENIFDKTLGLPIICDKYDSKDGKIFKEEESIDIPKILGSIKNLEEYQIHIKLTVCSYNVTYAS